MQDISAMGPEDAAVITLRQCGHFLHHSAGKDSGKENRALMSALTEAEMRQLTALLQKCLDSWKN